MIERGCQSGSPLYGRDLELPDMDIHEVDSDRLIYLTESLLEFTADYGFTFNDITLFCWIRQKAKAAVEVEIRHMAKTRDPRMIVRKHDDMDYFFQITGYDIENQIVIMKKFPISTQSFDRQGRLEKAALEEFISGKYQIWNYRDPRMFCVTLEDALYTDSENGLTNGCYHQGG
ncbi:hypothetical protein AAK899_12255 [Erysipelotrichaceae bacterium 51-3]